jgi:rhamnogalacturonyl hydrolase YesR
VKLYERNRDVKKLSGLQEELHHSRKHIGADADEPKWWCDALFMAPPRGQPWLGQRETIA